MVETDFGGKGPGNTTGRLYFLNACTNVACAISASRQLRPLLAADCLRAKQFALCKSF
jgi:hypothetical protein